MRRFVRYYLAKNAAPRYASLGMEQVVYPPLDTSFLPQLPGWITLGHSQASKDAAFSSGAALAYLHFVATSDQLPHGLWRDRLALLAAQGCVGFSGRGEGMVELRDAVHLIRPGDQPGPAGKIFTQWRQAIRQKISVQALQRALPEMTIDQITMQLDARSGNPVAAAAAVLEAVLAQAPRSETAAFILADAVLAKALGWTHLVPLLASGLKSRDLNKSGDDLVQACHRAVVSSAKSAGQLAAELRRRAGLLRAIAPKLRAKGAQKAVALFLSCDALAPTALLAEVSGLMSDRAARRLCDRLVQLGALRELTGRDSFRLYGV
jgi:hypothetical protein